MSRRRGKDQVGRKAMSIEIPDGNKGDRSHNRWKGLVQKNTSVVGVKKGVLTKKGLRVQI